MKFSADSKQLKEIISIADSLTEKNSAVFSDRYLKLSTINKKLEVSTSSQAFSCTLQLDEVEIDTPGVICAEFIAAFLKELQDDSKTACIFDEGNRIHIKRGRKLGKIPSVPVANYAERFQLDGEKVELFNFKKADLQNLVHAALTIRPDDCKNINIKAVNLISKDGILTAYFGNGITMFKMVMGKSDKDFVINIPLHVLPKLKTYLQLPLLQKDSSICMLKTDHAAIFRSSFGVFAAGLQTYSYPDVSKIFNTSKCTYVNFPIKELREHFQAAEGLFKEYDHIICNIKNTDDLKYFIISNTVKDFEYEGEISNPDSLEIDFNVYAAAIEAACNFIKESELAKFFLKISGKDVAMLGLESDTKMFITVPVIKQKVGA